MSRRLIRPEGKRQASPEPRVAALLALLFAVGCEHPQGPDAGSGPARIQPGIGPQAAQVTKPLPKPLVARVLDKIGQTISGVTVLWSVDGEGGSIAPATSVTNGQGYATAVWTLGTKAGLQTAHATTRQLQGKSAAPFTATALAGPLQSLEIPPQPVATVGAPLQLQAAPRDQFGNLITPAGVIWSSETPAVATVSPQGVFSGLLPCVAATVTASFQGKSASTVVLIARPLTVTYPGIDQVHQGVSYAETFGSTGGCGQVEWRVTGGAIPAGMQLGADGLLTGTPTALETYHFTVSARDTLGQEISHAFDVEACEPPVDLALGGTSIQTFPRRCKPLFRNPGSALLRVAVLPRSPTGLLQAIPPVPGGLTLTATALGGLAASAPFLPRAALSAAPSAQALDAARTAEVHVRLLELEMRRLGALRGTPPGPPLPNRKAFSAAPPAANRQFYVYAPDGVTRHPIDARLIVESPNVLYYRDEAQSALNLSEADVEAEAHRVVDYYEQYGKVIIDDDFGGLGPPGTTNDFVGGPRASADLDGNGKLIILEVAPQNMYGNANGLTTSCDRFPLPGHNTLPGVSCDGSNEAEIFYLQPGRPANNAVHEAKHVSSLGYYRFKPRDPTPGWMEEGSAVVAQELSSRFAQGLADRVEVRLADLERDCPPAPGLPCASTEKSAGIINAVSVATSYLRAAPRGALVGNPTPNPGGSNFYGPSWMFQRFLADQYGSAGDAAFFRGLNTGVGGMLGVEEATGKPFATLIAEFAAAVAVEGVPQARAAAAYRFRSYDLADIATGTVPGVWPYLLASADSPNTGFPLQAYYTGVSYFDFSAEGQNLRLDLRQSNGTPVAAATDAVLVMTRIR